MARQSLQRTTLVVVLTAVLIAITARRCGATTIDASVADVDETAARAWIDGEFAASMQGNFTAFVIALWNYNVNMSNETATALVRDSADNDDDDDDESNIRRSSDE